MATLLVMKMEMKGNEKCPHLNAKLMAKPHRKSQTENRTRERAFISSFFDATLTTIRIGLTTTRIERTNERASGLRRRRRHRRRHVQTEAKTVGRWRRESRSRKR